jgi:hypothetical protein
VVIEALHLPFHIRAFIKGKLHPVSALCVSILFVSMWSIICPMYLFLDMDLFDEGYYTDIDNIWFAFNMTRTACAALIGLLYLIYMCFAAPAVHYLRLEKKGKGRGRTKRGSERIDDGVELGNLDDEAGRKKAEEGRVDSGEFVAVPIYGKV